MLSFEDHICNMGAVIGHARIQSFTQVSADFLQHLPLLFEASLVFVSRFSWDSEKTLDLRYPKIKKNHMGLNLGILLASQYPPVAK